MKHKYLEKYGSFGKYEALYVYVCVNIATRFQVFLEFAYKKKCKYLD